MIEIKPHHWLMYNKDKIKNLHRVVSPPYDVISNALRIKLHQKHPNNVIRLILGNPHDLPSAIINDPDRYKKLKRTLNLWIKTSTLKQLHVPSFILVKETFKIERRIHHRVGLLCLVSMKRLGSKSIFGHERILKKAADDRFKVLTNTKAHLSPVFMLARDKHNRSLSNLKKICKNQKNQTFFSSDKKVKYDLWFITDTKDVKNIQNQFKGDQLMIADGHHRYNTAYRYYLKNKKRHPQSKNMLIYLCPANQKDLLLSSISRHIHSDRPLDWLINQLKANFHIQKRLANWRAFLKSKYLIALLDNQHAYFLKPKFNRFSNMIENTSTHVFSKMIEQSIFKLDNLNPQHQKFISYFKDRVELHKHNKANGGYSFWLKPLCMDDVFACAKKATFLPPKSTYFYPKIDTGIVFHKID